MSPGLLPLPVGAPLFEWQRAERHDRGRGSNTSSWISRSGYRWLHDCVGSLFDLVCGDQDAVLDDVMISFVQDLAVTHVRERCTLAASRVCVSGSPLQAWNGTLGSKGGYRHVPTGNNATCRRWRVKLPGINAGAVMLFSVLPDALGSMLECGKGLLRDPPPGVDELAVKPFINLALRRRGSDYGNFLGSIDGAGLIEPASQSLAVCTPLFVRRNDDLLRLIFDSRAANPFFSDVPHTSLLSPAALAAMEMPFSQDLAMRSGDVEVCVHVGCHLTCAPASRE